MKTNDDFPLLWIKTFLRFLGIFHWLKVSLLIFFISILSMMFLVRLLCGVVFLIIYYLTSPLYHYGFSSYFTCPILSFYFVLVNPQLRLWMGYFNMVLHSPRTSNVIIPEAWLMCLILPLLQGSHWLDEHVQAWGLCVCVLSAPLSYHQPPRFTAVWFMNICRLGRRACHCHFTLACLCGLSFCHSSVRLLLCIYYTPYYLRVSLEGGYAVPS